MIKLVSVLLLVCLSFTAGQDGSTIEDGGSGAASSFTQPCAVTDNDCIREYFATKVQCTRTSHNDGDPITRDVQVSYMPKFNVTIICLEDIITFFGSVVEKFEVNQATNNLVMTVNFQGINIYSPRANFVINLRGEEPKREQDYVNVTYSAAITAIIPDAGERGIAGAAISAFSTNAVPPFEIGPKVSQSSDEVVSNFFNALVSDIPTAVQELLLTKAPYFFYIYLQEYFCNYGIDYTGESLSTLN